MAKNKLVVDKSMLAEFIEASIKKTVNGKIDRVYDHLKLQDKKIAELKPLLEAKRTTELLLKAFGWGIGAIMTAGGAYLLFAQIIQTIPH